MTDNYHNHILVNYHGNHIFMRTAFVSKCCKNNGVFDWISNETAILLSCYLALISDKSATREFSNTLYSD